MKEKKIIYYILAAFVLGNLLLIFIQYNSTKNIDSLISGNEKLLEEFKVSGELKELESDINAVENNTKGVIITKDSSSIKGFEGKIAEVEDDLNQLQKINDDDTTIKYVDQLHDLVSRKLLFNKRVLDTLYKTGENLTENTIIQKEGKRLTDSILIVAQVIDSSRQKLLADVTVSIDKSGKKVQQFSTMLIILVVTSGAGLFWYIINIIRKQTQLIHQLNVSEKNVKEGAKLKEKFMANMSHEIRTPMNAILGFTNLLQRKDIDSESKEYVQTIQRSGENLLTIINDILDLSKIEAGMMRIESAQFNIRELVHSVEIMLNPRAVEKQLELTFHVAESIPATLEGDATRLTQILINLIGNALKFTSKGDISVRITNEGNDGNLIKTGIIVTDTGIGVEKDKLKNIFERFQQAEDSVVRNYGGTGLGLSIVKDLVLLQNGSIEIKSEPGKGTTFRLIIPYKISVNPVNNNYSTENNFMPQSDFTNVYILVVEDNEINQSLIKHLFKAWQLDFDLVKNGKEAIEKLQFKTYDLILMDIQMPEMDGYSAALEIRYNLDLDTPIIAMTAHAMEGEREKCLSYGMNEYISKPIREEQLHKMITEYTVHNTTTVITKEESVSKITARTYQFINLQYMKEVSLGNVEYEKTVTGQFIEMIPDDLLAIEKAWHNKEISVMHTIAHNMKTSISVMGLNEVLQPCLDALEYEKLNDDQFQKKYAYLKFICNSALKEAKIFYTTL